MEDLYAILGVDKDATDDELKKAYRKRACETHPDLNGGDSSAFVEVNKAYVILSNRKARLIYDRDGTTEPSNADTLRTDAIKELQSVILSLFNNMDDEIFFMDVKEHVTDIFQANILKAKNNIVDIRKNIRRLRRYKKRFLYKKPDDNDYLVGAILRKMYSETASIEDEVRKIRQFNIMIELLEDYDYIPEIVKNFADVGEAVQEELKKLLGGKKNDAREPKRRISND